MDPRTHAPGAGTPPPELAGRSALLEEAAVALDRITDGSDDRPAGSRQDRPSQPHRDASSPFSWKPRRIAHCPISRGAAAFEEWTVSQRLAPPRSGRFRPWPGSLAPRKSRGFEIGVEFSGERGLADSGVLDTTSANYFAPPAPPPSTSARLFVDELQVEERQLGSRAPPSGPARAPGDPVGSRTSSTTTTKFPGFIRLWGSTVRLIVRIRSTARAAELAVCRTVQIVELAAADAGSPNARRCFTVCRPCRIASASVDHALVEALRPHQGRASR